MGRRKLIRKVKKLRNDFSEYCYRRQNHLNTPEFKGDFHRLVGNKSKIFLDCGANNGCSVRKFRNEFDADSNFHIYSFEPNPAFAESFSEFTNHTYIPKAVWTEDGTLTFYDSIQDDKFGGTVRSDKVSGNIDYLNPLSVPCVDFSTWVNTTFSEDDFIVLKLDIEGAEYNVLPKMFVEGSIDKINLLFIEWHVEKIDVSMEKHKHIARELRNRGLTPYDWHAAAYIQG